MIVKNIIEWAVPFLLGGIVSGAAAYIRLKKKYLSALCDGVECLLRAEIISCHEIYYPMGKCPIYVKESLKRMYSAYHTLGGNDVATSLYNKIIDLPEMVEILEVE